MHEFHRMFCYVKSWYKRRTLFKHQPLKWHKFTSLSLLRNTHPSS
uniref:Uncharacterized protein n=1 Tax=Populus trichocarpa TaxID=3694 RepID=A0A3N7ES71_POPTR